MKEKLKISHNLSKFQITPPKQVRLWNIYKQNQRKKTRNKIKVRKKLTSEQNILILM